MHVITAGAASSNHVMLQVLTPNGRGRADRRVRLWFNAGMRVVAGTARGRKLVSPPGLGVRPTADRVRQATFNALESRGLVDGARVLDLFAGTGALGIEALSRGAAHATFVDRGRESIDAIWENIDTLGFRDRAVVVRSEVSRWLAMAPLSGPDAPDLVLADPPYTFAGWPELFEALVGSGAVLVAETGRPLDAEPGWEILRQQRYGSTVITVLGTIARVEPDLDASEVEQEQQA